MKKVIGLFFILTLCCVFSKAQQVVPSGGSSTKNGIAVDWILCGSLTGNNILIVKDPPILKNATVPDQTPGVVIKVYPTLTRDFTTIEISSPETSRFYIELYNSSGQKVLDRIIMDQPTRQINLAKLPAGIYYLKVFAPDKDQTYRSEKIIKL